MSFKEGDSEEMREEVVQRRNVSRLFNHMNPTRFKRVLAHANYLMNLEAKGKIELVKHGLQQDSRVQYRAQFWYWAICRKC